MIDWWRYGAKDKLEKLIQGRESSEEWVQPGARGNNVAERIKLYVQTEAKGLASYCGDSVELAIHADTRCNAISQFLADVSSEAIGIVEGPRSGHRLGLNGTYDSHLNIFVPGKRSHAGVS